MLTPEEKKILNIGGSGTTDTVVKPKSLLDIIGIVKKEESAIDKMYPQFKGQEISTYKEQAPVEQTKKTFGDYSRESKFKLSEFMSGDVKVKDGKISSPAIEKYDKASRPAQESIVKARKMEIADQSPLLNALESGPIARLTGGLQNLTSDFGVKGIARLDAIGSETYNEAYNKWIEAKQNPDNSGFKKFMYASQDAIPKVLIGIGLSRIPGVGTTLSRGFWSGLAIESERQSKGGEFDQASLGNIVIDTYADGLLGDFIGNLLRFPTVALRKTLLQTIKNIGLQSTKGGIVEGVTEVLQTFMRSANNYQNASTKEDREEIIEEVKRYITSGDMAIEFGVGALGGALATGGALGIQSYQQNQTNKTIQKDYIDRHISEAQDVVRETPEFVAENKQEFLDQTKKNIVDGLRADGYTEQADLIDKIDTSTIDTVEQLQSESEAVLSQIEPSTEIDMGIQTERPEESMFNRLKTSIGQSEFIQNQRIKAVDSLEEDYSKWLGETVSGKKRLSKAERVTQYKNKAGTVGKTPMRTLAEYGIIPETSGTKFDTIAQADRFRESVRFFVEAENKAVSEIAWSIPKQKFSDLENKAIQKVKDIGGTAGEVESKIQDVRDEFAALRRKYGDDIAIDDLQREKVLYFKPVKWETASLKPLARTTNYVIASTFQKNIERIAEEGGYKDVAQLNREIGDILEGANMLESLSGRSLKYGKIGKYMFMGVFSSLGRTPVGKILGALGGDMFAKFLMREDVATEVKRMLLKDLEAQSPEAYESTLKWLKQQGLEKELRLLLPEPKTIYVKPTQAGQEYTPNKQGFTTTPVVETQSVQPSALDINMATNKQTNVSNIDTNNTIKTEDKSSKTLDEQIKDYFDKNQFGLSIKDVSTEMDKYKTYEQFEKAINIIYYDSWFGKKSPKADEMLKKLDGLEFHGTTATEEIKNKGFKENKYWNDGIYTTKFPDRAIGYKGRGGSNKEGIFAIDTTKLKLKVISENDFHYINKGYGEMEDMVKKLKKTYDGVTLEDGFESLIWNVDKVNKQKPQTLEDIFNDLKKEKTNTKQPTKEEVYKEIGDLSTKILSRLEGKTTVSKQFISDMAKMADIKQVEKDLVNKVLETEGDKVNVQDFAKKLKLELLPLERKSATNRSGEFKYENISLDSKVRGEIDSYSENIYESPIKTSAGQTHFSGTNTKRYFGHTRTEDLAIGGKDASKYKIVKGGKVSEPPYDKIYQSYVIMNSKRKYSDPLFVAEDFKSKEEAVKALEKIKSSKESIRRVIEVQSDLYQKGNLEKEVKGEVFFNRGNNLPDNSPKRGKDLQKLQQYSDPTAHFRMVREEIKQAAQDGKTKLQFPTGETAMKIEGLGATEGWEMMGSTVEPEDLQVGLTISQNGNFDYIVTEILGDGKFKAVQKDILEEEWDVNRMELGSDFNEETKLEEGIRWANKSNKTETFDISGKVDTSNPIYKFYESTLGKYLTNNYQAKRITDKKGVEWYEVDIKPEMAKKPVMAFGMSTPEGMVIGSMLSAGLLAIMYALGSSTETFRQPEEPEEEKLQDFVPKEYVDTIIKNSKEKGVKPKIVAAILHNENRQWNPEMVNATGTDTGLGQINKKTQEQIAKITDKKYDYKDPEQNIEAATEYLKWLSERPYVEKKEDGTINEDELIIQYHLGPKGLWRYKNQPNRVFDEETGITYKQKGDMYLESVKSFL